MTTSPTFKFFLDNNQVVDPKGWDEGKINYKRHEALNALLYEFVSDLTFIGNGFDYLSSSLSNGFCNTVQLRIYKLNNELGTYYNLFEGIIMLRDMKVDEYKCEITCNAEDSTLIQQIIDFADNEFAIDGSDGMGWGVAPTPQKTLGIWSAIRIPPYTFSQFQRPGYLVFDILQYLMNCMTQGDNPVTILSNYFQSEVTTRYKSTIKFLNTTQLQPPITFTEFKWTNYLGVPQTALAATNAVVSAALLTIANHLTNFAANPVVTVHYFNDFVRGQWCDSDGIDTLTLESDFPIPNFDSVRSDGVPGLPVAYTKTDTVIGTDGMKNLALSTGAMLRNLSGATAPVMSFKKLFDELNKEFNLGCSIKNVQGVITFRIEPISYFFGSSAPSITITNVPNLQYEISPRFNKDQIKVGDGRNSENLKAGFAIQNTWYSGTKCTTEIVDCKNSFVVDWDEIDKQLSNTLTEYDEKIYLIECDTGTAGADYDSKLYRMGFVGSTAGYTMNNHLVNYWKIRRWLFSMSGGAKFGAKFIQNHNTIKPSREYTFEAPLTFTQAKALRNSEQDFIVFGPTDLSQDFKYGWIEEVSYNTLTGLTNFRLIAIE